MVAVRAVRSAPRARRPFGRGDAQSAHYYGGSGGTGLLWEIRGTNGILRVRGSIGHLQFGDVTAGC